jgi:hypothetical protein
MLNVVCVKWGNKYTFDYVNRLYHMIQRHLTLPYRFICLTDDPRGLQSGIEHSPFEEKSLRTWFTKMEIFKPPAVINDRILFLDLDTVIIRNIDDIARYSGKFAILYDLYLHPKPPVSQGRGWLGSAIMSFDPTYTEFIWTDFSKNLSGHMSRFAGDQQFIGNVFHSRNIQPDIWQDLFPGKFLSYKRHQLEGKDPIKHYPRASIVCFHGKPRPHEVVDRVKWMKEHWK